MARLKFYGLGLCLLLMIAPVSYADELPEVTEEGQQAMAAVDQVWAHLAEGDVAKTLAGHLQPGDAKLKERLAKALESQVELFESGMIQVRAVYARIEGDWALVPIYVTMKRDGETQTSVSECWAYRKTGEQGDKKGDKQEKAETWKIVSEGMMRDSRIKPLYQDELNVLQEWWHEHAAQLTKLKPKEKPSKE